MLTYLFNLLDATGRRQYATLAVISVVSSLLQAVGVASISVFFTVLLGGSLPRPIQSLIGDDENLVFLGGLVFLATLSGTLSSAFATYYGIRISWSQYPRLGSRLLGQFLQNDYEWHLTQTPTDLAKAVTTETQGITTLLQHCVLLLVRGMELLFIASLLFWVRPLVALSAFCSFSCIYGLLFTVNRSRISQLGKLSLDASTERYRSTNEALSGIKAVKVSQQERFFLDRFRAAASQMSDANSKIDYFSAMPKYFIETIVFSGLVGFVVVSNHRGWNTHESIPLLALYGAAAIRLLPAVQQLYLSATTLIAGGAVLKRVTEGLKPHEAAQPMTFLEGGNALLELRGVAYSYPGAASPALVGVDLHIYPGDKIGIVGATGAGKTTLADVLLGLIRPGSGGVYRESHEGKFVAYVPQQVHFVDDSFAANIALGEKSESWDTARIEKAAGQARIHDYISALPEGYATMIGEQGSRLSGGQRQRVGIARALYAEPALLVLDEASNALDAETERSVINSLLEQPELTLVIIAHRISILRDCSKIFLIENGSPTDSGTYAELLQKSAYFRRLVDADAGTSFVETSSS